MERMLAERDFNGFEPVFFTTSQAGQAAPSIGLDLPPLQDAHDLDALVRFDILVSCQGGDYTTDVYDKLRSRGFKGYWIDAASTLRMRDSSIIVLDPVNRDVIDAALAAGAKDYIGGNCTVSLMLMALAGLFRRKFVEGPDYVAFDSADGKAVSMPSAKSWRKADRWLCSMPPISTRWRLRCVLPVPKSSAKRVSKVDGVSISAIPMATRSLSGTRGNASSSCFGGLGMGDRTSSSP